MTVLKLQRSCEYLKIIKHIFTAPVVRYLTCDRQGSDVALTEKVITLMHVNLVLVPRYS